MNISPTWGTLIKGFIILCDTPRRKKISVVILKGHFYLAYLTTSMVVHALIFYFLFLTQMKELHCKEREEVHALILNYMSVGQSCKESQKLKLRPITFILGERAYHMSSEKEHTVHISLEKEDIKLLQQLQWRAFSQGNSFQYSRQGNIHVIFE
jgi:hypothetical protein